MNKVFLMGAAALVMFAFAAGCKQGPPPENLEPIPEALDDPAPLSGGTGLNSTPGGEFGANGGPGAWGSAESIGQKDADGWVLADPSGNRLNMPIIYFAYDSDVLVPSETANLDKIAAYLGKYRNLGLVIEGHCDNRGTEEYNRALGERRANAIRAYLAGKGVADNRMKTMSFGKDKPAVPGNSESVWRQNRRGVPVPMRMSGR